ncbi:MAG: DUF2905 domain-containing protein [Candidatus Brocadiia bacterium]
MTDGIGEQGPRGTLRGLLIGRLMLYAGSRWGKSACDLNGKGSAMTNQLGKLLLIAGGVLMLLGVVFLLGPKIPFIGRLPGDIRIKGDGWSFYFPIITCIVLSVILTLLLNVVIRLVGK